MKALITMTGQEVHGVMQAPLFTAQNDFTPLASSALVDAALRILGVNDDFNGCAPDIGAVERPRAVSSRSVRDIQG
ncbi:MAG TPA: hypothetical protein VM686_23330 [Polyangiaceae bacterium]|nr:hypothetical protein [Polyangiaceae bacterium]